MKTTACGRCGRQIVWARTAEGRSMPLDPTPTTRGNCYAHFVDGVLTVAVWVQSDKKPKPEGTPMMPHFATCGQPTAAEAAPAPPPPPPTTQESLF